LLAKIQTEQRAGIYSADVFGAGATTLLASMKRVGVLGKVSPTLILPEVTGGKFWIGNEVPVIDKDDTTFPMIGAVIRTIVYNTDMIKDGEITSYMDLLKPQYKGKITINDPTVTGSGNAVFYHLIYNLWGEEKTTDFLKKLITQQEAVIQRDNRIHTESVVRGKYAIGLAPLPDLISEFTTLKAPIKLALVEEDNRITSAAGCFGVPVKYAHPNAAAVFINWMLSKEGQTMFASTWGNPSLRKDVPTTGMDPLVIPDPNKKYYLQTEEEVKLRGEALTWSKKIIGSLQ
ncbi:MAG: extracellular solute-binding protein, partial [Dehalococcoidia bacterium]|nr:extracellular solute-binding protein [Dehalococcoidia bacterium]